LGESTIITIAVLLAAVAILAVAIYLIWLSHRLIKLLNRVDRLLQEQIEPILQRTELAERLITTPLVLISSCWAEIRKAVRGRRRR